MLYCIVLYCIVLYCIVYCSKVLHTILAFMIGTEIDLRKSTRIISWSCFILHAMHVQIMLFSLTYHYQGQDDMHSPKCECHRIANVCKAGTSESNNAHRLIHYILYKGYTNYNMGYVVQYSLWFSEDFLGYGCIPHISIGPFSFFILSKDIICSV